MADPRQERTPKEQEALYKAFAKLYCDASRPETFEKPIACYKALVDPNPPEYSLKKTPYRYLKNKVVQTEIARIRLSNKTVVEELEGMTHAQYVHECLQNARLFAERGGLGDSTASAQMMKLVGTAIGALVTRTEDVTKRPESKLTPAEQVLELQSRLSNYAKLLAAPVQEAEYTILEESNDNSSEGKGEVRGPDDGRRAATDQAGGEPVGRTLQVPSVPELPDTPPDGPAGSAADDTRDSASLRNGVSDV